MRYLLHTWNGVKWQFLMQEPLYGTSWQWQRTGPTGYGNSPEDAQSNWLLRMRAAGLPLHDGYLPLHRVDKSNGCHVQDSSVNMNAQPAPHEMPPRTAPSERRTRFFIVRNGDCFQPCNDEQFTGTDIAPFPEREAPFTEREAAIAASIKGATETHGTRCVYEVRLVGVTTPQDAQFKPVKVTVRKAKGAKRKK